MLVRSGHWEVEEMVFSKQNITKKVYANLHEMLTWLGCSGSAREERDPDRHSESFTFLLSYHHCSRAVRRV